jgi:uncharacterized protein
MGLVVSVSLPRRHPQQDELHTSGKKIASSTFMEGTSMPLAGVNRITDIALFVSDLPRAIVFYRDRMELELKRRDTGFAEFWMEGAILALWEEADVRRALDLADTPHRGPHAMIAIRLDSPAAVDAACAALAARGVLFRSLPKTYPWQAHAAYFSDPDDNLWEIYCWVGPPRTI